MGNRQDRLPREAIELQARQGAPEPGGSPEIYYFGTDDATGDFLQVTFPKETPHPDTGVLIQGAALVQRLNRFGSSPLGEPMVMQASAMGMPMMAGGMAGAGMFPGMANSMFPGMATGLGSGRVWVSPGWCLQTAGMMGEIAILRPMVTG